MAYLDIESENVVVMTSHCDAVEERESSESWRNVWKPVHQHAIEKLLYVRSQMKLLLKVLVPACLAVFYACLRNQRTIVSAVRKYLEPISLSSVSSLSGYVLSPSSKLIQRSKHPQQKTRENISEPEKCVTCDVLYDPSPEPIRADVIFIHGLHGSLEKTWKQGIWDVTDVRTVPMRQRHLQAAAPYQDTWSGSSVEGTEQDMDLVGDETLFDELMEDARMQDNNNEPEPYSKCWPRDWLPQDCPGVRVIALNYTTDPYLWRPLWVTKRNRTCMLERSREMMDHLKELGVGKNPIIWVGHSKGGLFVKQMIVDAYERGDDKLSGFYGNTRGIMFYSVPHRGSPCAQINLPLLRQSVELTEVQKDCREVLELHEKFLSLIEEQQLEAEIFSFIETVQTFMTFLYIQIVSIESAGGASCTESLPVSSTKVSDGCSTFRTFQLLNTLT
ncbi:uncharacterized protein LOC111869850 isoform X2 [Cryptotermes secundus]|uniref:uncharacterized protein LOC111869850 isoform X2 n=1 Tax=Cryptotermes secundus TaxID=105785 RepID=UPI000CD7D6CA|nr:uncharacterized protein LOC111869850 isoform X2 [Cryptotermes secundus]